MNLTNPLTQQPITDGELKSIVALVDELITKENQKAELEKELKELTERINTLSILAIPTAMSAIGLSNLQVTSGHILQVKPFYSCSMNEQDEESKQLKQQGLAWLRANKLGAVIKTEVKVPLGQGQEKLLKDVRAYLDKRAVPYALSEGVHNATLKSLMREMLEGGKPFPMDIFRGFSGKKATIINP